MKPFNRKFITVAAVVAMMVLAGGLTLASCAKESNHNTRKSSEDKNTPIPSLIRIVGEGYYAVSAVTQPLNSDSVPRDFWWREQVMDSLGNVISPVINGHIECVSGNHISYSDDGSFYFANLDGSNKERMGEFGTYLGNGLYSIGDFDNGNAIYNTEGKIVIPIARRSYNYYPEDGLISFSEWDTRKYGAVSYDGKIVLSPEYDYLSSCSEGYMSAIKNNKCGVIDRKGNVVIPFKYDSEEYWGDDDEDPLPMYVHKGITAAYKDGKWGVIDLKDNVIVPFEYDDVTVGSNGTVCAEVYSESGIKQTFFDSKGRKMNERTGTLTYLSRPDADYQSFSVRDDENNTKEGYMDRNGKVIISAIYDDTMPFLGPTALVNKDGAWHLIDRNGKIVKRNVAKYYFSKAVEMSIFEMGVFFREN